MLSTAARISSPVSPLKERELQRGSSAAFSLRSHRKPRTGRATLAGPPSSARAKQRRSAPCLRHFVARDLVRSLEEAKLPRAWTVDWGMFIEIGRF